MGKFKVLPVVLAAFCTVLISFFVFSFIDSNASGGTNPVNEQENNTEESNSEGSTNGKDSSGNSDITNNVQNNVNSNKADVSNDVENNVSGENADISNTIDNNLNNSNDNQIENNVTNNVEVNVNVNVSNNISNNADAPKSNKGEGNNEGNDNDDKNNGNKEEDSNGNNQEEANNEEDRIIWGVDSASLTTEEMLACVTDNFGSPDIWGRYLGDKDGVSKGLTSDEIELLHSNDIKILLIWNHFVDARGYENGQQQAQEAIQMAEDFGVPEGVAIFADIEPNYPVDAEFIRGWYETMSGSAYPPGVYGVFDAEQELYASLQQAGQDNGDLLANTYVWTAAPNIGITTEADAPEYQPEAPDNALIGGWQYGLDAQACNIDTNLFHSDLLDVVW